MRDVQKFAQQLKQARQGPRYWTELSKQEFAEGLRRVMGNMNQREFADLLPGKDGDGASEPHVSKLLAGHYNHTISKMNEIAHVLDAAVHICVAGRGSLVRWTIDTGGAKQEIAHSSEADPSETADGLAASESNVTHIETFRRTEASMRRATFMSEDSSGRAFERTEDAAEFGANAQMGGRHG